MKKFLVLDEDLCLLEDFDDFPTSHQLNRLSHEHGNSTEFVVAGIIATVEYEHGWRVDKK